jgi:hypothetical protein
VRRYKRRRSGSTLLRSLFHGVATFQCKSHNGPVGNNISCILRYCTFRTVPSVCELGTACFVLSFTLRSRFQRGTMQAWQVQLRACVTTFRCGDSNVCTAFLRRHTMTCTAIARRHVAGVARLLEDVVRATCERGGGGLLLIGPPGVGKTTLLRDVAHLVSEAMDREVVIVDTRWVGLGAMPLAGLCCCKCCGGGCGCSNVLLAPRLDSSFLCVDLIDSWRCNCCCFCVLAAAVAGMSPRVQPVLASQRQPLHCCSPFKVDALYVLTALRL